MEVEWFCLFYTTKRLESDCESGAVSDLKSVQKCGTKFLLAMVYLSKEGFDQSGKKGEIP